MDSESKTQPTVLVYDVHIYHYVWCPLSLKHVYFSNLEMKEEHAFRSVTGKTVNGNPFWLEKPSIQKLHGRTSESESIKEFMLYTTEEGEDAEIDTPVLLHDDENNVLLNVEKLVFKGGNWYPVLHGYKVKNVWFKNAMILTGIVTALRNAGIPCDSGYMADKKTGDLVIHVPIEDDMVETYLEILTEIRSTLEGKPVKKIAPSRCQYCCWSNCPSEFKWSVKSVKDDTGRTDL